MKKLKALEILDYYDYPLLFIAEDEQKKLFLCMLVNENDFLEYLIVESSVDNIEQLKHNKKDIRSIFEQPKDNTYYFAKLNSETDQGFEVANISRQEICHYFPERGVFLSEENSISKQESLNILQPSNKQIRAFSKKQFDAIAL